MGVVKQEIDGVAHNLLNSNLIDKIPDPFQFLPAVEVPLSSYIGSNEITVTGISSSTGIHIAGGEYSVNDGPYTAATSTVSRGENIRVRVLSGNAYNVTTSATLTIGGVSATFRVTTITPRVTFSQAFLRFLFQEVGTISPGQLILLTNSGSDPLHIVGFNPSGEFSSTDNSGTSVGIGESCSLFVYFTPVGPGIRKGTITIFSNAAENPHTVRLFGIGGINLIPQNFGIYRNGAWYIDRNVNAAVRTFVFPLSGDFQRTVRSLAIGRGMDLQRLEYIATECGTWTRMGAEPGTDARWMVVSGHLEGFRKISRSPETGMGMGEARSGFTGRGCGIWIRTGMGSGTGVEPIFALVLLEG
jgi:hypothetical protein